MIRLYWLSRDSITYEELHVLMITEAHQHQIDMTNKYKLTLSTCGWVQLRQNASWKINAFMPTSSTCTKMRRCLTNKLILGTVLIACRHTSHLNMLASTDGVYHSFGLPCCSCGFFIMMKMKAAEFMLFFQAGCRHRICDIGIELSTACQMGAYVTLCLYLKHNMFMEVTCT